MFETKLTLLSSLDEREKSYDFNSCIELTTLNSLKLNDI
jgi:hypothetical protein